VAADRVVSDFWMARTSLDLSYFGRFDMSRYEVSCRLPNEARKSKMGAIKTSVFGLKRSFGKPEKQELYDTTKALASFSQHHRTEAEQ